MDELFWRAAAGAALLGAAAGPVGCFVLWRRMAYLGASIAHMALLGAAIGLLLGVAPLVGVLVTSLAAALLLAPASRRDAWLGGLIPADTLIGLIGHAGLALGFVLIATMETVRADLLGYLFGDVLALGPGDLLAIALGAIATLAGLLFVWRPLLAATIAPEIAAAEAPQNMGTGRPGPLTADGIFLALVAGLIAFGLQVVGALLIVALLVIPPAAARPFARTPEGMAVLAAGFGAGAAPLGLGIAFAADLPAGPTIVLALAGLFLAAAGARRLTAGT